MLQSRTDSRVGFEALALATAHSESWCDAAQYLMLRTDATRSTHVEIMHALCEILLHVAPEVSQLHYVLARSCPDHSLFTDPWLH